MLPFFLPFTTACAVSIFSALFRLFAYFALRPIQWVWGKGGCVSFHLNYDDVMSSFLEEHGPQRVCLFT